MIYKEDGRTMKKDEVLIAQNEDEYTRLMFSIVMKACHFVPDEKLPEIVLGIVGLIKILANDYHNLVASGKMQSYAFAIDEESMFDEIEKAIRREMEETKMELAMDGVPTKETDGGKIEIDYEKLGEKYGRS